MSIESYSPNATKTENNSVTDALQSGLITPGPRTRQFEQELAKWCWTHKVACLSSATAALECALRLLGIGEGDEVITSAYTDAASASVICRVGATPVLLDTAPGSYEMDYQKLADAITEKTKAIIPLDIAGIMCDYDTLIEQLEAPEVKQRFTPTLGTLQELFYRVIIIADAAYSFGANRVGRPSGSIADFTALGFHPAKNPTADEGGALTWKQHAGLDNEAFYRKVVMYSLNGQSKGAFSENQDSACGRDVAALHYQCNMTDTVAAQGLTQLQQFLPMFSRRRAVLKRYETELASDKVEFIQHFTKAGRSNAHLCMVRLLGKDEEFRDRFIEGMASRKVSCNVHYKPLPLLTEYKDLGFNIEDYPNAYAQYANEVTLPMHSKMSDEDADYVIEAFKATYEELDT